MTKKVLRKIITIDEDKCNGCGLCIPSCAEGAMQIVNGKAKLITDKLCDGLGACLGSCPQGALILEEKEVDPFDEQAVEEHLKTYDPVAHGAPKGSVRNQVHAHGGGHQQPPLGGCPGSRAMALHRESPAVENKSTVQAGDVEISIKPQLSQWPVQLMLLPETAPYFKEAHLLITADCVPFAYPNYHLDLLKGKAVAVGCPKLDNVQFYIEKLARIIAHNNLQSITVAIMEVPCCTGLQMAVEEAVRRAGVKVPVEVVEIAIQGHKK